jgi:hypothetical protein
MWAEQMKSYNGNTIVLITQNDSFGKNWGAKNLGKLLRILKNVIEKSLINWRVLSLVKINTRISDTPCILEFRHNKLKIKFSNGIFCSANYFHDPNVAVDQFLFSFEISPSFVKLFFKHLYIICVT